MFFVDEGFHSVILGRNLLKNCLMWVTYRYCTYICKKIRSVICKYDVPQEKNLYLIVYDLYCFITTQKMSEFFFIVLFISFSSKVTIVTEKFWIPWNCKNKGKGWFKTKLPLYEILMIWYLFFYFIYINKCKEC